jgi:hypothetical protein
MIARLIAHERWVPLVAALAWWITFHPGFLSEDSFINLADARSGAISVWFTAWWVYVVDGLSLGTRVASLVSLASALALEYAVYFWIVTVFPKTPARAITVFLIAISPLVGAMGIQIRHDVALGAGLLICAAVLTRTWTTSLRGRDYLWLLMTPPLIATRHNGVPTVLAASALLLLTGRRRWRHAAALVLVAVGASAITFTATRASGNTDAVDPVQTVEWLMGDISCLLGRGGVEPTAGEWATLTTIAAREAWPQPGACRFMNPILLQRAANEAAVVVNYRELLGVWGSLARRYPLKMIAAHAERVRLFLPPMPPVEVISFLHSTIVPNDFGLDWTFPAIAERARVVVRAWNGLGFVLANSMIWLIALIVIAWRSPASRDRFIPTIVIGLALNAGLLVAAPISEGRYGLFILICGQAATLYQCVIPYNRMSMPTAYASGEKRKK